MTIKSIPAQLQADLDNDVGTITRITQILAKDGTVIGLCELDRDLELDLDLLPGPSNAAFTGLGVVTYQADPGFDPTELEAYHDLGVDGGDAFCLVPIDATPITPEDIRAGKWDDARFRVVQLNYEAPEHGYDEICFGYFGNITLRDNALLVIQLDGPTRPLKQTMCWLDSTTCRAVFGTQESEAIEFCGKDVTSLWINATVTAVDPDDSSRSFAASSLTQAAGYFLPGGLIWLTGDNAGNTFWGLDTHGTGGVLGLRQALPRPVQVGDTFKVRIDCTKLPEGEKGCRFHFGNEWVLHFRGEPDIHTAVNAMTPGSRTGPGQGGATQDAGVEFDTE